MPDWVVVASATAIALGTYTGGWRIIKTMGTRIIKMDSAQGFSSQGAGAAVILASSHFGYPLSTTHVINGGIMGAGAAKRAVRGALGRGREHRRRVGAHAAGGGASAARSCGRRADLRHGRARPADRVGRCCSGWSWRIFARRIQQGSPVTATGTSRREPARRLGADRRLGGPRPGGALLAWRRHRHRVVLLARRHRARPASPRRAAGTAAAPAPWPTDCSRSSACWRRSARSCSASS